MLLEWYNRVDKPRVAGPGNELELDGGGRAGESHRAFHNRILRVCIRETGGLVSGEFQRCVLNAEERRQARTVGSHFLFERRSE